MTVAVLFARSDSIYKTMPECDVYDIDRDARTWPGGCPVVAHPPCRAWGQFAMFAKPREDEKALAPWAIEQVRRFGGVLEHPHGSRLWPELGLPAPGQFDEFGGWTLPIHQHWWGHRAEKKTKLYIVGCAPQDIPAIPMRLDEPTHVIGDVGRAGFVCKCGHKFSVSLGKYGCPNCCGDSGAARSLKRPEVGKDEREHTPPDLAAWLVELARRCKPGVVPMTADQFELMQKIQTSPAAPPRIYNWLSSQMSIARYYGGLKYMGYEYFIAPYEDGRPLVRADVLEAESKAKKQKAVEAQGDLP